jgi:hypothetical protein
MFQFDLGPNLLDGRPFDAVNGKARRPHRLKPLPAKGWHVSHFARQEAGRHRVHETDSVLRISSHGLSQADKRAILAYPGSVSGLKLMLKMKFSQTHGCGATQHRGSRRSWEASMPSFRGISVRQKNYVTVGWCLSFLATGSLQPDHECVPCA